MEMLDRLIRGDGGGGGTRGARARRVLPLVLLGLALMAAGVGALGAHRAQTGHRAAAEAALRDYGAFAAWSYGGIADGVVHDLTRDPLFPPKTALLEAASPEGSLAGILAAARSRRSCSCDRAVAGGFAFMVRPTGPPDARFVGRPPLPVAREAIVAGLRGEVGTVERGDHGHGVLEVVDSLGGRTLLGWARVQGRTDTLLYGIELDPAAVSALLGAAFRDGQLLPPSLTRGRANDELIAVTLETASGFPLYASAPGVALDLPATSPLGQGALGLVARASVLPGVADELLIGGLPRSQMPWLLLLFGVAGLLTLVAVSILRREHRLAEERTDFVASVSHELRTPLAQIRLFVETLMLGRARSPAERDWALATVDRETVRLTRLVENILRFSRVERGVAVHPQPVSLVEAAESVAEAFRPMIRAETASIVVDVARDVMAEADPDALRQVLLNFLDNAVKYGPRGQTIRVEGGGDGPWAWLAVADRGPGVPAAERSEIWNAFRRGRDARGSVATGSGIGLSVVRALVDAQDGRCRVEEAEGGGARFVVELPRVHTVRRDRFEGLPGPGTGARPEPGESGESDVA